MEWKRLWIVVVWAVLSGGLPAQLQSPLEKAQTFEALKYRHIGPLGNRVIAVTGVAGDANIYYVGAASGGIFKSVDGGAHWEPIFDSQPAASIGSLAVAPSDPNVVWAGTGETFIRSNVSSGMESTAPRTLGRRGTTWGWRRRAESGGS